jgi:hypothetical protein
MTQNTRFVAWLLAPEDPQDILSVFTALFVFRPDRWADDHGEPSEGECG